ncbi:hypothetical protein BD626DRAFT_67376 [Schizophyllum amplum]|uniref:Uncharacterized protein n=1 Tax=Schizophyllum amplum TaxID=97359 RepID=A0A550CBD1_9AGAR|nr:hypothetical protein BD626DRAFT_67376 [Auriculariopsis ampla]
MSFLFSCYASRLLRLFLLDLFLLDPLTSGFIIPLLCFARSLTDTPCRYIGASFFAPTHGYLYSYITAALEPWLP